MRIIAIAQGRAGERRSERGREHLLGALSGENSKGVEEEEEEEVYV